MSTKVLVVDDSAFFRRRIKDILERDPRLKVVGFADNGRTAVEQARALQPDVITMDYEMPLMDGISAVRQIMAEQPTPILMFSSLSYEGARVTLDALDAGALDYLPKSFESMSGDAGDSARQLQERVLAIARRSTLKRQPAPSTEVAASPRRSIANKPRAADGTASNSATRKDSAKASPLDTLHGERPRLIMIGASTGGPVAIQDILVRLPAGYPFPILLIQHMPGTFTSAYAERLNRLCRIQVKEAQDGDLIRPGTALLAPGGKQMLLDANGQAVSVIAGTDQVQYRPSVDVTFGSAARNVRGKLLALVLTGMGADGREGCRLLKRNGATIWTQSERSCVVYGMPMAVATAGMSDAEVDINEAGMYLSELH
ncbi:MAG: chemotaxis response regulator protein-glutamate methylesterase [Pseudomonadota bacterium]|nr:chemotaxis response regulator protein-glutamate methylesterase [Pseudomonadales bacterium]MDY6919473.1 chemotaxis response regulator protein-glutamate methylesterase [Pseudomonadota bacterium]